jgi:hypothetical protein
MFFWAGIGIVAACAIWLLIAHREKTPKTAVDRIELRKNNIRREYLASWQESRKLGSAEEVGHWLKRKIPSLDDEWLAKNCKGIADEALIDSALVHLFSTPNIIEWFLKTDLEAQAGKAAEMN